MVKTNKFSLVGIDPGETTSGVAIINDGSIASGANIDNCSLVEFIKQHKETCETLIVVIEDMRPYNARVTNATIRTIKFIGQIEMRLDDAGITYYLAPRWWIKQWVFLEYKEVAMPRILSKIEYRKVQRDKEGKKARKIAASFIFVDDWIVTRVMKQHWNIPNATVHNRNKYGLKDHSWQALALITFYMMRVDFFAQQTPAISYSSSPNSPESSHTCP